MINLAIVCLVLLILPFVLGYLHVSMKKPAHPILIYYRYFMTFNMFFAGLFVSIRMFVDGLHAAQISGWPYSPIFHLYGIAIFSMTLLGLFTMYGRSRLLLSSAIVWSLFLILSSVAHLFQISRHTIADINVIYVHIIYDIVASIIMWIFLYSFKKFFAQKQD